LLGALRAAAAGAAIGLVLVLVALWEAQEPAWLQPLLVAGAVATVMLCGVLLYRPSRAHAARLADRRLDLEERLATALEIVEGRLSSPMAPRQVEDALRAVQDRPLAAVAPRDALRRPAARAAGLLLAFMAAYLVGNSVEPEQGPVASVRRAMEELVQRTGMLAQSAQIPLVSRSDELDPFSAPPPPALLSPQNEEQLREQLARSRNQQAALSRLARALTGTAAAREIGEQLDRGNYSQAAQAVRNLGLQNDQLSRQAKSELAEALRQAAGDTRDVSPDLAREEDRAARALSGRDYRQAQQALDRLAQAMTDAGQQVVPQEELAQALQRLQEERNASSDLEFEGGSSSSGGDFELSEGAANSLGPGVMLEEDQGMLNQAGAPSANVGNYNPNARPTRLNVAGKEVQVEGRPTGRGESRGVGRSSSPAVSIQDSEETGALLEGVPQPTDPVRDTAERTNVPFGHLETVHNYFKGGEKP
jgi:hypothetical protein